MPRSGWWTAWWWAEGRTVTVAICTPPQLNAGTWSYVDLEVDLVLRADGTVLVVDEDEFVELATHKSLPWPVAEAVTDETTRMQSDLGDEPPVVAAGWSWLDRSTRLGLADPPDTGVS